MFPEFLQDAEKTYWTQEEFFRFSEGDWVHAMLLRDYAIGMHAQGFIEINIVTAGRGRHYIGSQSLDIERGDVFIIPPDVRHGYAGGAGLDVYHMMISRRFWEKYTADLQTLPFFVTLFSVEPLMRSSGSAPMYLKIKDSQFETVYPLMKTLIKWSRASNPIEAVMCNSAALMLIAQLCAVYKENYNPAKIAGEPEYHMAFMESVAYIYKKYYEKISIDELAKSAMLSRSAYLAMFKRVMGTTPARFLLSYRLEKAKAMLADTSIPVVVIAEKTGFYDASHFSRCFQRAEGCTPLAYRERSQ